MVDQAGESFPQINERDRGAPPRILCIPDGPNWIFNRHIQALSRYLGDEFEFSTVYRGDPYDEEGFDLIYPLEFNMVTPEQIHQPLKYVTGVRSFVSWVDWDFPNFITCLNQLYQQVHTVSRQLYELLSPYIPQLVYITHGVDVNHFSPRGTRQPKAGQLRIGWAGNRLTLVKGFREFIQPLAEIPGVELVYCGFADRNFTMDEMPGFYDSIDVYVSASSFEGNNNSLLEAASMECAILTTANGTTPEYLVDRQSALIVERDLEQFRQAAIQLRDDSGLRVQLGKQARQAIIQGGWDWQSRAEDYRRFFRHALKHATEKPDSVPSFEVVDYRHYAEILGLQYRLERELKTGLAFQNGELEYQLQATRAKLTEYEETLILTQQDLDQILSSDNYKLAAALQNTRAGQSLLNLYRASRKAGKRE
jgi:hypothetical protein